VISKNWMNLVIFPKKLVGFNYSNISYNSGTPWTDASLFNSYSSFHFM